MTKVFTEALWHWCGAVTLVTEATEGYSWILSLKLHIEGTHGVYRILSLKLHMEGTQSLQDSVTEAAH